MADVPECGERETGPFDVRRPTPDSIESSNYSLNAVANVALLRGKRAAST